MKRNAKFWVCIALLLCLISSVGASVFQTDFGKVEYNDLTIETDSGHKLDAFLLVPENHPEYKEYLLRLKKGTVRDIPDNLKVKVRMRKFIDLMIK